MNIEIYNNLSKDLIPDTESLKDTYERVIPYFNRVISKDLKNNVLISAHGNSIRALCKYLFNLDNNIISKLEIPTGNPLKLHLKDNKVLSASYLDQARSKDLIIF